jgi:hypothetical protein
MATVRVSFVLGGERFHGRLNRSSVLSDVPAKATRVNRAGPGYKVIRLRATEPTANRGVAEQLSAPEISRSLDARCGGPAPMEACERSLIASPPVLPVLSVSPLSFLHLQPGARQGGRGVR